MARIDAVQYDQAIRFVAGNNPYVDEWKGDSRYNKAKRMLDKLIQHALKIDDDTQSVASGGFLVRRHRANGVELGIFVDPSVGGTIIPADTADLA